MNDRKTPEPETEQPPNTAEVGRVREPARKAIEAIRTGVAAATDPIVERVGQAIDDVERSWHERPGARVRRVRQMGATALPYLKDVHPDARLARPVQVGLRTIDVDDIAGTAVGGGAQRGGDFLPLKPFRGQNWMGRWQRLRQAQDHLATLPPIDVQKHGGRYWVVDGHNRVALAKYTGQPEIDANIVELVPPGERRTEPILSLAASAADSRSRSGPRAAAIRPVTRCRGRSGRPRRARPRMTRRLTVVWPDRRPFEGRNGEPIRLLAVSDAVDPALEPDQSRGDRADRRHRRLRGPGARLSRLPGRRLPRAGRVRPRQSRPRRPLVGDGARGAAPSFQRPPRRCLRDHRRAVRVAWTQTAPGAPRRRVGVAGRHPR